MIRLCHYLLLTYILSFSVTNTVASCDPISSLTSQVKGCALLKTKLLITSIGTKPTSEVHRDILMLLSDAFAGDDFIEFIPDLMTASYLGPNPEAITLSDSTATEDESRNNMSILAIVFSVSCIVLFFKMMMFVAFPKMRKRTMGKVISYYQQKRNKRLPTCSGPTTAGEELAGELLIQNSNYPGKEWSSHGHSGHSVEGNREYGEVDSTHLLK